MNLSVKQYVNQSVFSFLFSRSRTKTKGVFGQGPMLDQRIFDFRSQLQYGTGGVQAFAAATVSASAGMTAIATPLMRALQLPLQSQQARSRLDQIASSGEQDPVLPPPTKTEIQNAIDAAGGEDAVSPWLVDGKTKLDIGGRRVIVEIGAPAAEGGAADNAAGADDGGDGKAGLLESIRRFGLSEGDLEGGAEGLRSKLREAADAAGRESPELAAAIEYAVEDAFDKIRAWENQENGAPLSYEEQADVNHRQVESIAAQLGLAGGQVWGIQSVGYDLAVFGMDMTALSRHPDNLMPAITKKAEEMLAALETRYAGTEKEYQREANRINGALSRLTAGLAVSDANMTAISNRALSRTLSATVSASSSMSWQSTSAAIDQAAALSAVSVKVEGEVISSSRILSLGMVVTDPLVFDLSGDGISLKSAEEGVEFDMAGDGGKETMGFIRGDDAFLFVDVFDDGRVHDGRQLFGNFGDHANGFDMLAAYDENGDGVIDESDGIFDKLRFWLEKSENGVCEDGESISLRDAGVKSISLSYRNTREDDGKGNLIGQLGSFTRSDGSEGVAADVWLKQRV